MIFPNLKVRAGAIFFSAAAGVLFGTGLACAKLIKLNSIVDIRGMGEDAQGLEELRIELPDAPPSPSGRYNRMPTNVVQYLYPSGIWKGGRAVIEYAKDLSYAEISIYDAFGALQRVYSLTSKSNDRLVVAQVPSGGNSQGGGNFSPPSNRPRQRGGEPPSQSAARNEPQIVYPKNGDDTTRRTFSAPSSIVPPAQSDTGNADQEGGASARTSRDSAPSNDQDNGVRTIASSKLNRRGQSSPLADTRASAVSAAVPATTSAGSANDSSSPSTSTSSRRTRRKRVEENVDLHPIAPSAGGSAIDAEAAAMGGSSPGDTATSSNGSGSSAPSVSAGRSETAASSNDSSSDRKSSKKTTRRRGSKGGTTEATGADADLRGLNTADDDALIRAAKALTNDSTKRTKRTSSRGESGPETVPEPTLENVPDAQPPEPQIVSAPENTPNAGSGTDSNSSAPGDVKNFLDSPNARQAAADDPSAVASRKKTKQSQPDMTDLANSQPDVPPSDVSSFLNSPTQKPVYVDDTVQAKPAAGTRRKGNNQDAEIDLAMARLNGQKYAIPGEANKFLNSPTQKGTFKELAPEKSERPTVSPAIRRLINPEVNDPEKGVMPANDMEKFSGPMYGRHREFERRVYNKKNQKSKVQGYDFYVDEVDRKAEKRTVYYYKNEPGRHPKVIETEHFNHVTFLSNYDIKDTGPAK